MPVEWKKSHTPVRYEEAITYMEKRVEDIKNDIQDECIWFLEHPPLYTAGTSAKKDDLLDPRFEVHQTGRGGQYTYHGPGQRVVYAMLDLKRRYKSPDLRRYIYSLEQWIIETLKEFDINGERRQGRVGIWVSNGREEKIAAIGVRVRRWVTYHGLCINLNPDLSHFEGIVPCGLSEFGVTSIHKHGQQSVSFKDLDRALVNNFYKIFDS